MALLLSGGAFAATEDTPADTAAAPAAASPDSANQATPRPEATEQAKEHAEPNVPAEDQAIADKLRDLIESSLSRHVARESDRAAVRDFYQGRGYVPLWIGHNSPLPRAKDAITFLRGVEADGLDPMDYPTPSFAGADPAHLAAAELKLTNSILAFVRHASTGRVAFTRVSGAVYFDLKHPEPADVLAKIANSKSIRETLDAFNPQHPDYKALKAQLAAERHRDAAKAANVEISGGPVLHPGEKDPRVSVLRKRLKLPAGDDQTYDKELSAAVKAFQQQSGLHPDGLLGPTTLARLNGEPNIDRVDLIIANMERWRWLPRQFGASYVVVNVPDYTLKVVDRGKAVWSTRIVVGKPGSHATPLLTETMKYITVNPTWNVPPSIIRNEYLPALQRDPGALARIGLRVGHNADGSIRVYQPPGERNALGRIRFNFPNRFLVYQHDTPDKHLFDKATRAYSHGCMRVQNPDQYAEVLLSISQPGDGYTAKRIHSLYGKSERSITFKTPIPVYVTYQTAFVDDAGKLQIRPDIYGLDKAITKLRQDERGTADIPIARNYYSGSKPVMGSIPRSPRQDVAARPYVWSGDPDYVPGRYRPFDRYRSW